MASTLTKSEPTLKQTSESNRAATPKTETEMATASVPVPKVRKRIWLWIVGLLAVVGICVYGVPWIREMMDTVATDDAYVNGDLTYVAPRVSGQVAAFTLRKTTSFAKAIC